MAPLDPLPRAFTRALASPRTSLVIVFAAWKTLLLLIAFASPGPGYDTSTTLLLGRDAAASALVSASVPWTATLGERLASKLTRWDAIYFTVAAERGYQHEQDWAFSWAFNRFIAQVAKFFPVAGRPLTAHVWAGVIISHISHLLSVLVLHRLTAIVVPGSARKQIAFLAAALHACSPAGVFLSAPYGEALFSLLNFSGMLWYAYARVDAAPPILAGLDENGWRPKSARSLLYSLISGLCFGLATMVRSNGLLSGLIFFYDIIQSLHGLFGPRIGQISSLMRIIGAVIAGLLVGMGFIIPQWLAYQQYCLKENTRPWCSKTPPSIYSWVQKHYWNVGFLRYWTPSNIPLFLLAAPMLWVMTISALRVIPRLSTLPSAASAAVKQNSAEKSSMRAETPHLLVAFGLPQLVLAALAVTNFHVQIVNRISSGYPEWYIVIMSSFCHSKEPKTPAVVSQYAAKSIFRLIIVYAAVQAALFASFLPPA
ncbi:GPI mannosyltransferase 2-like protein [Macrophomina phaseolina MS6]|uniref:GPI mannosyltransferase 2 n=1 Tax=Macrophomina phaseolina (strain MS6) TaxID=1126212 RepID=K2QTR2_MACPH|nr:GPI mannosyltransferase 2-like protein [Macrophomina phaseolina MS6]